MTTNREAAKRGILFVGPMALAIHENAKTMTRRTSRLDDCPDEFLLPVDGKSDLAPVFNKAINRWAISRSRVFDPRGDGVWCGDAGGIKCPYGDVGDVLYVREAGYLGPQANRFEHSAGFDDAAHSAARFYGADHKPGVHMPRWAARSFIELTGVSIGRLAAITEEDCVAEGAATHMPGRGGSLKETFRAFFCSLGKRNGDLWDRNPWVWILSFKKVQADVSTAGG